MSPDAGEDIASDNEVTDDEWDGMGVVTVEGGAGKGGDKTR